MKGHVQRKVDYAFISFICGNNSNIYDIYKFPQYGPQWKMSALLCHKMVQRRVWSLLGKQISRKKNNCLKMKNYQRNYKGKSTLSYVIIIREICKRSCKKWNWPLKEGFNSHDLDTFWSLRYVHSWRWIEMMFHQLIILCLYATNWS